MVIVLALAALTFLTPLADLTGKVTVSGDTATYTDRSREFSISVPKGWWFRDTFELEGVHIGETKLGGGTGLRNSKTVTWDPGFVVIKLKPGSVKDHLKPWKGNRSQGYLQKGKAGDVQYIAWWALGWTYIAGYVESPTGVWRIEVHVPKATWRQQLPLAESIIGSFKLLTLLQGRLAPADESLRDSGSNRDASSLSSTRRLGTQDIFLNLPLLSSEVGRPRNSANRLP